MLIRILLAAILGGFVMFAWESVAHMALPLGEAGVKALPNEDSTRAALGSTISEPGFYFFPAPRTSPGMSKEQQQEAMKQAMEKMKSGPAGIMVVNPRGAEMMMPRQLALQFAFDVGAMLLAAILLTWAAPKCYVSRVAFVTVLGIFPTLAVELPLWNWYGFPTVYMGAQLVVHLLGFLVGGLVAGALVRVRQSRPT